MNECLELPGVITPEGVRRDMRVIAVHKFDLNPFDQPFADTYMEMYFHTDPYEDDNGNKRVLLSGFPRGAVGTVPVNRLFKAGLALIECTEPNIGALYALMCAEGRLVPAEKLKTSYPDWCPDASFELAQTKRDLQRTIDQAEELKASRDMTNRQIDKLVARIEKLQAEIDRLTRAQDE